MFERPEEEKRNWGGPSWTAVVVLLVVNTILLVTLCWTTLEEVATWLGFLGK